VITWAGVVAIRALRYEALLLPCHSANRPLELSPSNHNYLHPEITMIAPAYPDRAAGWTRIIGQRARFLSPFASIDPILVALMSTQETTPALRQRDVIRRFNRAAAAFPDSDFVHRHAFNGLLERMQPMQLQAQRVLDLGCATGAGSRLLAKSWRRNQVISLDISAAMLRKARQSRSRLAGISEVRANATQLPFATGSMDLVVANMLLPWIGDLSGFFTEIARVLRIDGLFLYSTLGSSSLAALRQAWRRVDSDLHIHPFEDMHNIADAVMRAGLRNPIVDTDPLVVSYRDQQALFRDLTAVGARNSLQGRCRGLTGKHRFAQMRRTLQTSFVDGTLNIELELVYGHAWGGGPVQSPREFHLAASQIGRRRR